MRQDAEKLEALSQLTEYRPKKPRECLKYLLELRHFLSDWCISCCFHVARNQTWSVEPDHVVSCLRHPVGFVREAVLSYVKDVSPRALSELLPLMIHDPDPIVSQQVKTLARQRLNQQWSEANS